MDAWEFDAPKDYLAISLREIAEGRSPILHVSHNLNDGAWQFLGWDTPKIEDAVRVCLEDIVALDGSVRELATLPLGWHAWRRTVIESWVKEPNPYDEKSNA
ncbi:hypothetical protein GTP46_21955 [Duganella sp. FT135W]|uniref:DUF2185 domain-containing protein n=1 Tax=Duganella flavida TaxID=2692175 RepID=A0A6L8KCT6_9BURK|nr:hypothetical protein [Duganella flavida]MYM25299.1 hypothetical protein [Duganella flavida]